MHWFDYVMSRCPRHGDYDEHDDLVVYQDGRWVDFWNEFIHRSVRFSLSPLSPSSSFRSSRHIVVLIVVSFFHYRLFSSFISFFYIYTIYLLLLFCSPHRASSACSAYTNYSVGQISALATCFPHLRNTTRRRHTSNLVRHKAHNLFLTCAAGT